MAEFDPSRGARRMNAETKLLINRLDRYLKRYAIELKAACRKHRDGKVPSVKRRAQRNADDRANLDDDHVLVPQQG